MFSASKCRPCAWTPAGATTDGSAFEPTLHSTNIADIAVCPSESIALASWAVPMLAAKAASAFCAEAWSKRIRAEIILRRKTASSVPVLDSVTPVGRSAGCTVQLPRDRDADALDSWTTLEEGFPGQVYLTLKQQQPPSAELCIHSVAAESL